MIAQLLGWIATIIFTLEIIPQCIKTCKTQTTKGVSIVQYIAFFAGNIIALIYASMIGQAPLIIKYILALVSVILYFIIYYKVWRKESVVNQQ